MLSDAELLIDAPHNFLKASWNGCRGISREQEEEIPLFDDVPPSIITKVVWKICKDYI